MQTNYKDLYSEASKETGVSEQIYKDIGSFVFTELHNQFRRPKALIVKLKGVGSWYLRKKRMEDVVHFFEKDTNELEDPTELLDYKSRKEVYDIFVERLKDYEKYITLRDETRDIRYQTQILLEPDSRKD